MTKLEIEKKALQHIDDALGSFKQFTDKPSQALIELASKYVKEGKAPPKELLLKEAVKNEPELEIALAAGTVIQAETVVKEYRQGDIVMTPTESTATTVVKLNAKAETPAASLMAVVAGNTAANQAKQEAQSFLHGVAMMQAMDFKPKVYEASDLPRAPYAFNRTVYLANVQSFKEEIKKGNVTVDFDAMKTMKEKAMLFADNRPFTKAASFMNMAPKMSAMNFAA